MTHFAYSTSDKEWQWVTMSDNEWQWVTMCDGHREKTDTTFENFWWNSSLIQQMTTSDNVWQGVTTNDNE